MGIQKTQSGQGEIEFNRFNQAYYKGKKITKTVNGYYIGHDKWSLLTLEQALDKCTLLSGKA